MTVSKQSLIDGPSGLNEDLSVLRDPHDRKTPMTHLQDVLVTDDGDVFPIVGGVPRFVSSENYAASFGEQWTEFPKTQLDSHSGLNITELRLRRCIGRDLEELRGQLVLEAGSGAGRFTEVLLKHGAILHSFDFSRAVEANASNHAKADRLTLVQADILEIPFAENHYDTVLCLGVLQHTPNPEDSIRSLWRMVRPGGSLVIDHYRPYLWYWLPPPLGDAEKLYRWIILKLPQTRRAAATRALTDFWFPIYWRFRRSKWARRILARIAGIHFYYGIVPLRDRQQYYEWSLLDTHDGMTDRYKHMRTERQIERFLQELGATDIDVSRGGNGVEARCRKAAQPR
jgi:2-polyprenyl-3-methyl-5-hydroxy-6-metoxy-1,4-benzoquinol methylase